MIVICQQLLQPIINLYSALTIPSLSILSDIFTISSLLSKASQLKVYSTEKVGVCQLEKVTFLQVIA